MQKKSVHDFGPNSGSKAGDNQSMTTDIRLHSGRGRHILRFLLVSLGVVICGLLIGLTGIFFLFQGGAIQSDALNNRIERSITGFLGADYDVQLGSTNIEFRGAGLVSITSANVEIRSIGGNSSIAAIRKVLVGVEPWSLVNGTPKVNSVTLDGVELNMAGLSNNSALQVPESMSDALTIAGKNLNQLVQRLRQSKLQKLSIVDSNLSGFFPGPRSTGNFAIDEFTLTDGAANSIVASLKAVSGFSKLSAEATYSIVDDKKASLKISFNGADFREWVQDPSDIAEIKGFIGANAKISGQFELAFDKDGAPQQPVINLRAGPGELRLGRKGFTKINGLALNFRLFPKLNRIILENSQISVGGFRAQIVGGITPVNPGEGLAGDIDYTFVVQRAQGTPAHSGEKVHPGSMIIEGGFNRVGKIINIDQLNLSLAGGNLVGSGSFGFEGETPSLVFNGVSGGMPVAALKQFWPIFLATPVRSWMRDHVHGGKITSATVSLSIPAGIIGRLHKGKKFNEDQLKLDISVESARIDTFGELPPVRNAEGTIKIRGMRTEVVLGSGVIYGDGGKPVSLEQGKFTLLDASIKPLVANTSFVAKGDISSLARITNAKPLNVMDKLKMVSTQWSGKGEVDLVAEFPLKKKLQYDEVSWQALVRLDNAKSSKPVAGRSIANADVVIDISPQKAVITGNSTIDGIRGNVLMIEPVGKNSKVKRKRVLKARMGPKDRKKLGIAVAPVITGLIDVVMEQNEGRKAAQIFVDLKDAEISLPWIGWRKGEGIPAKASFRMTLANNTTKIHDLKMTGEGFYLNGDLVIDKKGIKSVDIPAVSLNEGDDLSLRIRRKKGEYTITANGKYFDGRVLVNKLFHQEGVGDEQGQATFRLSANIDRVKGFQNRYANNLVLHYSVKKGWLDALSLDTRFGANQTATIEAGTTGKTTKFEIRSQNAGSALSFLNIYTHMRNGILVSNLKRHPGEPFFGDILVENFTVVDEPRLKKLVSNKQLDDFDNGGAVKRQFSKIKTNTARFISAQSTIEKGQGYLKMNGSLTGVHIGLTYDGTLFDKKNRMNLQGTFMPAFGISRMVSVIPFVGQLLSNGKDSGLIGINYQLSGPTASPKLELNPLSIVAPGIFKNVFQPRRK